MGKTADGYLPVQSSVILDVYGSSATNTWIYYTNTSPLSTIIWLNFATKLCQAQKPVLGPSGGQKDTACHAKAQSLREGAFAHFVPLREKNLRTPDCGGFFGQFRLLVRIQASKEVKGLAGSHNAEISKGISQYFSGL